MGAAAIGRVPPGTLLLLLRKYRILVISPDKKQLNKLRKGGGSCSFLVFGFIVNFQWIGEVLKSPEIHTFISKYEKSLIGLRRVYGVNFIKLFKILRGI